MKLSGIKKLTEEELRDVEDALDPYSFENYCGSCVFYDTENCPHRNIVLNDTDWRYDISCDKFFS